MHNRQSFIITAFPSKTMKSGTRAIVLLSNTFLLSVKIPLVTYKQLGENNP